MGESAAGGDAASQRLFVSGRVDDVGASCGTIPIFDDGLAEAGALFLSQERSACATAVGNLPGGNLLNEHCQRAAVRDELVDVARVGPVFDVCRCYGHGDAGQNAGLLEPVEGAESFRSE